MLETAASVICLLFDCSAPRLCPVVKGLGRDHVWPPHQPAPHLLLPVTAVRQDGNLRSPWSVRQSYKTILSEKSQLISHKAMSWLKSVVGYFWYRGYQTKTPQFPRLNLHNYLSSRTPWMELVVEFRVVIFTNRRSQWPRGLRRMSVAARLLRLWARIPPGAWMFVCCECCVLSGRGLCDGLITRPEESY